jgi:hypothetical protein
VSEVLDAPVSTEPKMSAPDTLPKPPSTPIDPAKPVVSTPESLIHALSPAEPQPDAFSFADKVLAKNEAGQPDWEATARNAEKARQHLEKKLGTGDIPPASAAEYTFAPPEELKDFALKDDRIESFKAEALKHGFTKGQFEFAMNAFLASAGDLMEGAAKLTATQARTELQKYWPTTAEIESNLQNAGRAIRGLPADLQQATVELGTNPAFLRAMAFYGAQTREDAPPSGALPPSTGGASIESLMASEAYRNSRHPDHQRVSQQVAAFYQRVHGDTPI